MKENSIEEDIEELKRLLYRNELTQYGKRKIINYYEQQEKNYKRVLKENEELTISNKEIDKECSRLEEKEVKLINKNEHYKDLIHALEIYYDITEEDLEKCMKNDR